MSFSDEEKVELLFLEKKKYGHTFYFIYSNSMSTSETDSMDDHPPTSRTRALSISELIKSLHMQSPGTVTDGTTIGECFLDVLCTKYSGMSAGMTIYEDSLRTNIIGEFVRTYL